LSERLIDFIYSIEREESNKNKKSLKSCDIEAFNFVGPDGLEPPTL